MRFHRICAPLDSRVRANNAVGGDAFAVAALTNHRDAAITNQAYHGDHQRYIMMPFWSPAPSRFSDGSYGVLYSANALVTALDEHTFHLGRRLADAGTPAIIIQRAHLRLGFLEALARAKVDPSILDPDPANYRSAQAFGRELRARGTAGLLYPSVRYARGTCAGVFIPRVVSDVQLVTEDLPLRWDGSAIHTK